MSDERERVEPKLAAELAAVERQLARLTPAGPRIDRDRLMFEAGRASANPVELREDLARPKRPGYIAGPSRAGHKFWPAATATMTAATVLLATALVWQMQSPVGAPQTSPLQIAVVPIVAAPNVNAPLPPLDLAKAGWPMNRQPKSGYLGVRYAALTGNVSKTELDLRETNNGANAEIDGTPTPPATARDLLHEFVPSTKRPSHSST